jgi:hypothetical protein
LFTAGPVVELGRLDAHGGPALLGRVAAGRHPTRSSSVCLAVELDLTSAVGGRTTRASWCGASHAPHPDGELFRAVESGRRMKIL